MENWNALVKPEDTVIHLGDFCYPDRRPSNVYRYKDQLNGTIILIPGNHDQKRVKKCFRPNCYEQLVITVGPYTCLCRHFYNEYPDDPEYDFLLCGHSHNKAALWTRNHLNLSVELHDYKPMSEEALVALLNERRTLWHAEN